MQPLSLYDKIAIVLYLLLSPLPSAISLRYRYMTNIAIVLYLLLSPSIFCYLLPLSF